MTNEEIADRLFQRVESMIGKALAPVLERLGELEGVQVPTAADVAKTILAGEEMAALVDLHVSEAVAQIEPPKDGQDATPEMVGKAVSEYLKQNPPEKGKDGLDLKDLFRAEGGRLMAVLSDGTTRDLGPFVGKDGRSVEGLTRTYSPDSHEVVEKWMTPDGEKELRYPAGGIRPGGYWREGTKAVAGQVFNHGGPAWIAKRDTSAKPCRESDDWEIFANKGRDGQDGKVIKAPEPVRLGSGNA